uniref:flagellar hook-basal body complex protein FliE n=1 Tax=Pararhizobium sp. IMCC3301 TaxID=3067904 RepID=UPI0035319CCD
MNTALGASNAYSAISKATSQLPAKPAQQAQEPNASFASMVSQVATDAVATGQGGEQASMAFATGQPTANMVEMVTAVAETELALQTMVSVRDRVISAYEEIMRMPI